ncbi:serine hydrolase domain-containing protein [Dactylosporangium sp. NPDC051541]|uniref:serine hydrolase domain-containing protein n=1 Tax=Dactylosporangium sp. NPDC051541 TaxID=3363977 RepID=UPI0037BC3DB9
MRRMLSLLVVASFAVVAPTAKEASAAPAGCGDVSTAGALFDEQLQPHIGNDRIPGAVVSVVSGGRTVFSKGYGLADVERQTPMDPKTSGVRIASITKLFTYTAVMQQVEAGKLSLGADVNTYLTAFKIPATFPQPITLLDLMNHTAGFEDQIIGTGARTAADVPPLGEFLAGHMPRRIRPPGQVSAYSNYGAALAGYIVAETAHEPYDQYVQRHILDPLGMAHSSATEPPPFTPVRSYNTEEHPVRTVPFIFDPLTPDGAVTASADDLAEFMKAHLAGGGKLLSPATAQLMHTRSFAADPRLGGYAHGFQDRTMNGHRVLMHDGGWEGFASVLLLVPDCDLGLFLSFNSTRAADAFGVVPAFLDRFAPKITPSKVDAPATGAPKPGFYAPTRHNDSTVEHLLMLLGPMRLTVAGDGTVHFKGHEYTDVGGGLYAQRDGDDHLVFRDGRVATDGPEYELLGTTDSLPFNLILLAVFVVVALGTLVALRRRPLTAAASMLGVVFLALLTWALGWHSRDFIYGAPWWFQALLTLPVLVVVGFIAAVAEAIRGWATTRPRGRIHQVVSLGGLALITWFFWNWNLFLAF